MSDNPLPTFLVIGAQKSATRWLKVNLGEHPDVFVAPSEVGYFHKPERVRDEGPRWYRQQFDGWSGQPVVGEGTPGYMIWHHRPVDIAERIHALVPDVRLVAVLRNPVDRALSAFVHHQQWGDIEEGADFMAMVREVAASGVLDAGPPRSCIPGWGGPQTLITGGWYGASLEPYVDRFAGQLLVVLHDDVATAPEDVYRSVTDHVGADPGFVPPDLDSVRFSNLRRRRWRRNQGRRLSDAERREVFALFRDDIARLEALTGLDLHRWDPR
jgi:hypothetical protein